MPRTVRSPYSLRSLRRMWDSNPRNRLGFGGLVNRWFKPLTQSSNIFSVSAETKGISLLQSSIGCHDFSFFKIVGNLFESLCNMLPAYYFVSAFAVLKRRRKDSNLRRGLALTSLAVRRFRPLSHVSIFTPTRLRVRTSSPTSFQSDEVSSQHTSSTQPRLRIFPLY